MAIFAGLAGSVQIAVMARLGERVGIFGARAFASLLQAVLAGLLLLAVRQNLGGYAPVARQPAWLWLGGVMGAAIDRFGWFGSERIPLSWARVLGIGLLFVGAALSLRK